MRLFIEIILLPVLLLKELSCLLSGFAMFVAFIIAQVLLFNITTNIQIILIICMSYFLFYLLGIAIVLKWYLDVMDNN